MEKLSARKKGAIVGDYLSGLSYSEISARQHVSTGSVANVVADLKAGGFPEAGDIGEQLEQLKGLSLDLKRANLTPGKCAVGLMVLARINECGLEPADIDRWPEILKSVGNEDEAREFVRLVYSIQEVQKRTGLSIDALHDKVHELEKKAAELEPVSGKLADFKKQVAELSKQRKELSSEVVNLEEKAIVPARSVFILGRVFDKTPRTPPSTADSLISVITAKRQIHIALIGENKFRVDFGQSASVVINLIQGNPPEWLQLIPKGEPILQSHLFAPQLEAAVKRVRDIAKGGSGIVRMEFAEGKLTVSAVGEEQEIRATLDVIRTQGEPGRTALNYAYLLRYLAGKQGIIALSQYDPTGPLAFEYQNSPRVLIMPMSVQWGDEPVAVDEPEAETVEENPEEAESEASLEEEAVEAAQETGEVTPEPEETVAAAAKPASKKRRRKTTT